MYERILTVTLTIPVECDRNLHGEASRERLEHAAKAFLRTARSQGVGVDLDGTVMEVEYNYRRFGYEEPIKPPRRAG